MGDYSVVSYDDLSNEELYRLLKERAPEVAAVAGEVQDSNRETVIAILSLIGDSGKQPDGT